MNLRKTLSLRGPNIWARFPVLEAWVEAVRLDCCESPRFEELDARLAAELPAYALVGPAGEGPNVTAAIPPAPPVDCATLLAKLALALQIQQGRSLRFWLRADGGETGVQIAVQYENEDEGLAALDAAREILLALIDNTEYDLPAAIAAVQAAGQATRLTPSTRLLAEAAKARGIPVRIVDAQLVQLGHGVRQRRIGATVADATSSLAEQISGNASLTRTLLRSVGVPVEEDQPAPGEFHRLLVVGNQVVAAARGLVDVEMPEAGRWVDVTDQVHPEVAARAVESAAVVGLAIAGVDVVAVDIRRPLEGQRGAVVGVIATPDLMIHRTPRSNVSRNVADPIVDHLFPASATGRIPIVSVTGTNGKTTTVRLIAHILAIPGKKVGMTCTEGIYFGSRRIDTGDCSGPKSAKSLLVHPQVEAVVLETARGGILREGLGFDRADVSVVTNIAEGDHLGLGGIHTVEGLARVKRVVAENANVSVLKADDPLTAAMAPHCPGAVVFIARDGEHPVVAAHRAAGGRAVFVRDKAIVVADGTTEIPLLNLDRVPLTHNGRVAFQVENVLAATAATWSLGVPAEVIRTGLESFSATVDKAPGRFNMMEVRGATVIFDYGHNPSSLIAILETLAQFPQERRICIYSAAGDRRDEDLIRQGQLLGDAFDRVILYEDQYVRGRQPGEIIEVFKRGLSQGRRVQSVQGYLGWAKALEETLAALTPGELLLVQADAVDSAMEFVEKHLAATSREIGLKEVLPEQKAAADKPEPAPTPVPAPRQ